MRLFTTLALIASPLAFLTPAVAQDAPTAVRAAIEAATQRSGSNSAERINEWAGLAEQLKRVEQCSAGGSVDDCLREAARYREQARNPEIAGIWSNVVQELQAQKATREERLLAEVTQLLTQAREACLSARKADDLDPLVSRLVDLQGQRTRATPRVGTRLRYIDSAAQFVQLWQQALLAAELADVNGAQQAIQSMVGMSQVVVPREEIAKLRARLGTDDEALIRRADDALAAAGQAARTARKAEDLRPAIEALNALQPLRSSISGTRFQARMSSVERALQALDHWSYYLNAQAAGDTAGARQAIQDLLNSVGSSDRMVIPRSLVEARQADLAARGGDEFAELLKGARVEDIPSLAQRAQTLSERSRDYATRQNLAGVLQQMAVCVQALASRRPTDAISALNQTASVPGAAAPALQALRAQLEAQTLRMAFDLEVSADAAGGPLAELGRQADRAAEKADWAKLQGLLVALNAFPSPPGSAVGSELSACQFLQAGIRFEGAGLWIDAVDCYRRVLAQPGKRSPHAAATERLQNVLRDHPQAQPQRTAGPDASTAFLDAAGTLTPSRPAVYYPGFSSYSSLFR